MSRPTPNILLTERDSEILVVLTLRIRVLSLEQISRTWWQDSVDPTIAARRRLQQLEAGGHLEQITLMAHPEVSVEEPICSWEPGQELPDFGNVAWQLNKRWSSPLVTTECVIATRFAGQFFGGHGGRKPRRAETTHDLHLSAVFLQMMVTHPQRAMTWSSEEELQFPGKFLIGC